MVGFRNVLSHSCFFESTRNQPRMVCGLKSAFVGGCWRMCVCVFSLIFLRPFHVFAYVLKRKRIKCFVFVPLLLWTPFLLKRNEKKTTPGVRRTHQITSEHHIFLAVFLLFPCCFPALFSFSCMYKFSSLTEGRGKAQGFFFPARWGRR